MGLGEKSAGSFSVVLFSGVVTCSRLGRGLVVVIGVGAGSAGTRCRLTGGSVTRVVSAVASPRPLPGLRDSKGIRFADACSGRRFYGVIRGAGRCVFSNSVFRYIISEEFRTGCGGSLVGTCEILEDAGPSPCVICVSVSNSRVVDASPRALMGLRGKILGAFPVTNSHPENGASARSGTLTSRLVRSRGRLTRRGVLISLKQGSVKGVSRFGSIGIAGCRRILHCSGVVRVYDRIRNGLGSKLSTFSTVRSLLPTNALSNTPGVETYRVVRRLREAPQNMCNKTLKCISFGNGLSAYVTVEVTIGGGSGICIRTNTNVMTSDIPRDRCRRACGGTLTIVGTIVGTKRMGTL